MTSAVVQINTDNDLVMGRLLDLLPKAGPPIVAWDLVRNRESVRR